MAELCYAGLFSNVCLQMGTRLVSVIQSSGVSAAGVANDSWKSLLYRGCLQLRYVSTI